LHLVRIESVGELVTGLLRFSCCELFLLDDASWGTGIVREPGGRVTPAVGSRYQATASEDSNRLRKPSVPCSGYEVCRTVRT
jgi:hypothetical protein